jgi:putative endonuclease
MYYVYVLKNENTKELYYGYTNNLERRFDEHNINRKRKLIYYEAYLSELDAREREKKLKYYGQTRTCLKNRLKDSLRLGN